MWGWGGVLFSALELCFITRKLTGWDSKHVYKQHVTFCVVPTHTPLLSKLDWCGVVPPKQWRRQHWELNQVGEIASFHRGSGGSLEVSRQPSTLCQLGYVSKLEGERETILILFFF